MLLIFHFSGIERYIYSLAQGVASWPAGILSPTWLWAPLRVLLSCEWMCHKQRLLKYACVVGLAILPFGDLLWEEHALGSPCPFSLGPRINSGGADLYNPAARSQAQQTHSLYVQTCRWLLLLVTSCVVGCYRALQWQRCLLQRASLCCVVKSRGIEAFSSVWMLSHHLLALLSWAVFCILGLSSVKWENHLPPRNILEIRCMHVNYFEQCQADSVCLCF